MKALLPLLFLASCGPYYVGKQPTEAPAALSVAREAEVAAPTEESTVGPQPASMQTVGAPAPKIGWDGKEVVANDRPLHGVATGEDTKSSLLGMFMDAKEEVDQLKLEVMSLRSLKTEQDDLLAARGAALEERAATIAGLQGELTTERERAADLEARLVTAQIRRLEAERQLLLNILAAEPQPATATPFSQVKP